MDCKKTADWTATAVHRPMVASPSILETKRPVQTRLNKAVATSPRPVLAQPHIYPLYTPKNPALTLFYMVFNRFS